MSDIDGLRSARAAIMGLREKHLSFRREADSRELRSYETTNCLAIWECVEAIDALIQAEEKVLM